LDGKRVWPGKEDRMKKAFLFVGIIAWASVATTARAQDKGQLGVTAAIGFGPGDGSGSIGVLYHLSKSVALRPSFGYSRSELDGGFFDSGMGDLMSGSGSTSTQWSAGLAGLFFLTRKDGLSTYVGASAAYGRLTHEEAFVPVRPAMGAGDTRTDDGTVVRAFLGMQYAVAKRFGLYGELGVRYYSYAGDRSADSTGFSTVGAGLGAIFYLK
jgi:hypothetical protein